MKKINLLPLTLIALAPLTSCGNGNQELVKEVNDFLSARGVQTTVDIPFLSSIDNKSIVHKESETELDFYAPYFWIVVKGNHEEEYKNALKNAEWTVTDEKTLYGWECLDKNELVEIDIDYYSEAEAEEWDAYAGTHIYIYAYEDIKPEEYSYDGDLQTDISAFLAAREVANPPVIPFIKDIQNSEVTDFDVVTDFFLDWFGYTNPPYLSFEIGSNRIDEFVTSLTSATWVQQESEWDDDYLFTDPNSKITINIYESFDEGTSIQIVTCNDQAVADEANTPYELQPGTVSEQVREFLDLNEREDLTIPFIDTITEADIVAIDYDADGRKGIAYYRVVISGDKVADVTAALKDAGWTVPETPSSYGYECLEDPEDETKAEVDVNYMSEEDASEYYPAGTYISIYPTIPMVY